MQFNTEKFCNVWDELLPVMRMMGKEVGCKGLLVNPKLEFYQNLQDNDLFKLYLARNQSGEIIGFSMFAIFNHHHYGEVFAHQDAFYVLPSHRGIASIKFFKFVDKDLENCGIKYILRHSVPEADWSRTLERFGYKEKERVYLRRVIL